LKLRHCHRMYNDGVSPASTTTGATTAEKMEGTYRYRGMDAAADHFLFFLRPFLASRYCSTHVSPILFPYSSFLLPLNLPRTSSHHTDQRIITASCKSWMGPNTLGSDDLQSWKGRVPRVPYGGCAYEHNHSLHTQDRLLYLDY